MHRRKENIYGKRGCLDANGRIIEDADYKRRKRDSGQKDWTSRPETMEQAKNFRGNCSGIIPMTPQDFVAPVSFVDRQGKYIRGENDKK